MTDDRTPALDLPLPHPDNTLQDDVARLRSAIIALDTAVSGKANAADIQAALADLVGAAPDALNTLVELSNALGDDPDFAATVMTLLAGKAASAHTHAIADVTGLDAALQSKADRFIYSPPTVANKVLADGEHCPVAAAGLVMTLPPAPAQGAKCRISVGAFSNTVVEYGGADQWVINAPGVTVTFEFDGAEWRYF